MKKRTIVIMSIVASALLVGIICVNMALANKAKKIGDFYSNNASAIKSMSVTSGNTGDMINVSKDDYQKITDMLSKLSFDGEYKGEQSDGWSYRLAISDGKDDVTITFAGNKCDINGKEYNVSSLTEVQEMLKQLFEASKS